MNIVEMTSLRGAHSGGPCLEIALGMGKTGAAAHGVRAVFASCSRLRAAFTFMFCIICFCGDESITFAQVCVRAYAFYVWYIGISAHIDKCI